MVGSNASLCTHLNHGYLRVKEEPEETDRAEAGPAPGTRLRSR